MKKTQALYILLGIVVVGIVLIFAFSSSLLQWFAQLQRQTFGGSGYKPYQQTEKKQKPEYKFLFAKDEALNGQTKQTQRYIVQAVGKPQALTAVKMRIIVTYDTLPSFSPKKLSLSAFTKETGWDVVVNDVRIEKEKKQIVYELSALHVSENGYVPQETMTIGSIDVVLPQKGTATMKFDAEKVALLYKTGDAAILEYVEEMLVAK